MNNIVLKQSQKVHLFGLRSITSDKNLTWSQRLILCRFMSFVASDDNPFVYTDKQAFLDFSISTSTLNKILYDLQSQGFIEIYSKLNSNIKQRQIYVLNFWENTKDEIQKMDLVDPKNGSTEIQKMDLVDPKNGSSSIYSKDYSKEYSKERVINPPHTTPKPPPKTDLFSLEDVEVFISNFIKNYEKHFPNYKSFNQQLFAIRFYEHYKANDFKDKNGKRINLQQKLIDWLNQDLQSHEEKCNQMSSQALAVSTKASAYSETVKARMKKFDEGAKLYNKKKYDLNNSNELKDAEVVSVNDVENDPDVLKTEKPLSLENLKVLP